MVMARTTKVNDENHVEGIVLVSRDAHKTSIPVKSSPTEHTDAIL